MAYSQTVIGVGFILMATTSLASAAGALDATGQGGQLHVEGGSAAPSSGGGCAIGPTRSGQSLWLVLLLAVAWVIVRSLRRAPVPALGGGWPSCPQFPSPSCPQSSGHPWLSGNPAAPPGCPPKDCGHDGLEGA